jgi:hypothetical protein
MDGAIAATSEDCVATGSDRLADLLRRVLGRFREYQIRLNPSAPKHL